MFASLLALMRKQHLDLELESEIRAHLELAERDALARGLSREDARREARRRFGGIEQMKEHHRDRRSFRWIETVLRDFRYGVASLLRAPGFTTVVVGVLALGIGGTVAMFSVVDAVLLKPLPFPQPDRIVGVWEAPRPGAVNATTAPQFLAWKRQAHIFDALAAEQPILAALNEKSGPARIAGKAVTAEYFKVFATAGQARPDLHIGRRSAWSRARHRHQPRRLANLLRKRSRHLAPAASSWTVSPIRSLAFSSPAPSIVTRPNSGSRSSSLPISYRAKRIGSPFTGVSGPAPR